MSVVTAEVRALRNAKRFLKPQADDQVSTKPAAPFDPVLATARLHDESRDLRWPALGTVTVQLCR